MATEVSALLARLGLSEYDGVFVDEEINDVALLASMGPEMLRENLDELGLSEAAVAKLSAELFPGADNDDDGLELEDNDADPAVPSGAPPSAPDPPPRAPIAAVAVGPLPEGPPVDVLPNDLTQEEIDAAEAEAQWLLNPLSMLDMSDLKAQLLKVMAQGVDYQKRGQFANARATFTRALAMEAPNKSMSAALYYNRSACQRELGQLQLALTDAQKAAELEPTMVKALWRAADVACIIGDHEAANEAIAAGLKLEPRNQPLLQLKLKVQKF